MKKILDSLLNSWEHWENLQQESYLLAQEVVSSKEEVKALQPKIYSLMKAWVNDDDNIRTNIQINYHTDPNKYNQETINFIKKFVQIQ